MTGGVSRAVRFIAYFLLYSLVGTVTHEYMHLMVLRALGGEGTVYFGIGPIIFPWDESHVIPTRIPTDLISTLVYTSSGGLLAALILMVFYLGYSDRMIKAALELTIIPQVTWTLVEPLARLGRQVPGGVSQVTGLLPPVDAYHLLLFGSWLVAAIHLSGVHRRLPFFAEPRSRVP